MQEQPKVVVVDDEPEIVSLVCEALEYDGFKAVVCDHGNKALGCIYKEQPSLVLLDVQMPGMDGIQIFEQMRAHPLTATTPVIFFTANSQRVTERVPNYRERNAALLPKPFDVLELFELVYRFLPQS
jgi:DNA-binding response OmpR family regulator